MTQAAIWQVWGPLLTIAIIFAIRFRRAGRDRPLRLWSLWLVPLLVVTVVAAVMLRLRPPQLGYLAFALGTGVGAIIGWHRGKLIRLRKDADGRIHQQVSPAAVLLLLGIVALRFVIQRGSGASPPDQPAPLAAIMVSDALIGLAAAIIVVTQIEVAIRVRRLLRET